MVEKCRKLLAITSYSSFCYRDAADKLYSVCEQVGIGMFDAPFDVQTALEVIMTGSFERLPSMIPALANLNDSQQQRCDVEHTKKPKLFANLLRRCLLQTNIPRKIFQDIIIDEKGGFVKLSRKGCFDVDLCPALDIPQLTGSTTKIEKAITDATGANGHNTNRSNENGGGVKSTNYFWHILDYRYFIESSVKPLPMFPMDKETFRMSLEVCNF